MLNRIGGNVSTHMLKGSVYFQEYCVFMPFDRYCTAILNELFNSIQPYMMEEPQTVQDRSFSQYYTGREHRHITHNSTSPRPSTSREGYFKRAHRNKKPKMNTITNTISRTSTAALTNCTLHSVPTLPAHPKSHDARRPIRRATHISDSGPADKSMLNL